MKTNLRFQFLTILTMTSGLMMSACSPVSNGKSQAAAEISDALPPELAGARLLYQRADGIYQKTLGTTRAEKLADQATQPRWSPDGLSVAYLRGNQIIHRVLSEDNEQVITTDDKIRTLVFHPNGRELLFAGGKKIKAVDIKSGEPRTLFEGSDFFELDVSRDGGFVAVTEKTLGGYRVRRYDLASGKRTEIGKGCSANVSPGGEWITVNNSDHTKLELVASDGGKAERYLSAPAGHKLDNQRWSNHADWIAGIIEGNEQDIMVQRVSDDKVWRVTMEGDADRPDLWVD